MKEREYLPPAMSYGEGLYVYFIKSGVPGPVLTDALGTGTTRIILVTGGTVEIALTDTKHILQPQNILTIPATLTGSSSTSENSYSLYLLKASTPFLVAHSLTSIGNDSFDFLLTQQPVVIHTSLQAYTTIVGLFAYMETLVTNTNSSLFQKEKVTLCFNLLLYELAEIYSYTFTNIIKKRNQREKLALGFLTLVAQHCREQHGVQFYAGRLFVTPDYLNKVVRDITGSTVKHFIEQALIAEAKNLLDATEYTVREISETLNFSYPGSFSTFFKKLTGVSPSAYRLKRIAQT